MADMYQASSFSIPVKDADLARRRMVAIAEFIRATEPFTTNPFPEELFPDGVGQDDQKAIVDESEMGFQWELLDGQLVFYQMDFINMEQAVAVAQLMLDLEDDDNIYTAEWSISCSKARPGEFGGGAVAFNRRNAEWLDTGRAARLCSERLG